MATKQEPKVNTNSPEWRRGFVDGVIVKAIASRLDAALGRLASDDEQAEGMKALRGVTLEEFARRCLAAEDIIQDDRKRFLAIIKPR